MQINVQRILGVLVIFQAVAPFFIMVVLLGSFVKLGTGIYSAVDTGWEKTSANIALANVQIEAVRKEAGRILHEVKEIKGAAQAFSGDLKKAVEPLRRALLGLQSTVGVIVRAVESMINGVIHAVNYVPFVDISKVNLKRHLNLKAFTINLPEVNLNISPDFTAAKQLAHISQDVATDTVDVLNDVAETFRFWWLVMQWLFIAFVCWFVLFLIGYLMRVSERIKSGLRLLKGESVERAWQLL